MPSAIKIESPIHLAPPAGLTPDQLREQHLERAKIARAKRLRALYRITDPRDRRRAHEADAALCAADPVFWINNWGWVRDEHADNPDLRDCPFMLWPSQEEAARWFLRQLERGEVALARKSRKKGISWLALHLIYHGWRFRGASAVLASRVEDLVDKRGDMDSLFEKIRYIHGKQPPHLKEPRVEDHHMVFKNLRNGAELKGTSTNENPKRGGRAEIYFVDEFFAIPSRIADNVIRATESVGRSRWFVGNTDDPQHPGERLAENLDPEQVRDMPWQMDPYLDAEWRRSVEFPHGPLTKEQAKQEYDCVAGAVSGHKIFSGIRDEVVGYREDSPEWERIKASARAAWQVVGGWDFGSGASLLCNVNALVYWPEDPRGFHLWIDCARIMRQTAWPTAARDVLEMLAEYGGPKSQYGDPAGEAAESDQGSWIGNLRSGGVPVWPLPYTINSTVNRDWGIKHTQYLIDNGRLHINVTPRAPEGAPVDAEPRDDCALVLAAMKAWERDIPTWVTNLDVVSRANVPPKKDGNSHLCEAVLYLVSAVLLMLKVRIAEKEARGAAPQQSAAAQLSALAGAGSRGALAGIFAELYGTGR